tara:strand:+ start:1972 stop:3192 length:1221 start_codon:yes stop_codon:yes gene_type:complete
MATPKLRFKEFDGYLEKNNLINLTLWASGGTPSKKNKDYWMGDIPLISGASMHTRKICESEFNITDLGLKKGSKLAPKNSILILVRGSMLFKKIPMGMALKDVAFNQDVKSIITKEDLNEYYFFQWLLSQENIIQNKVTSTGIGAGKLDTSELQNLEIYYPAKEEQTKIATFLSAVDTKIDELIQKHELLVEYKKGMMQQLFSQKVRFKADGGSDFKDWKNVKLGNILLNYKLGGNYKNSEKPTMHPLIKMGNIGRGSIHLDKIEYIIQGESIDSDDIVKLDDLFFNTRNTLELVGKVAIWRNEIPVAYYNSNLMRMKFENNRFMNYLFNETNSLKKLKAIASGTTSVAAIYTKDLLKVDLSIPSNIEQTKIANFLTAIDQKINNVAEQIDHAKTWKKGLLQQMFV